jgi:hypothetical protein
MKERRILGIMAAILSIVVLSPTIFPAIVNTTTFIPGSLQSSVGAITINGNGDSQLGTTYPGSGTVLDPYRIENQTINATHSGSSIQLTQVTVHLELYRDQFRDTIDSSGHLP